MKRRTWIFLGMYAALIVALSPHRVILRGDDFAYVESTADTIRFHHWVPSEWLSPFNLILPYVGAAIYAVTRNFWLSTVGFEVAVAIGAYALLRVWLRPQNCRDELTALVVAVSPVWLNKALEYSSVSLGMLLMLGALAAWRAGWPRLFFAVVAVAVANRQSSVALLVLPALEIVRMAQGGRRADWSIILGFVVVAGFAGALFLGLPPTFSRAITAVRRQQEFSWIGVAGNAVLAGVLLSAVSGAWQLLRHGISLPSVRERIRHPWGPLAFLVAGVWLSVAEPATWCFETPGLDLFALGFVALASVLGAFWGQWHATKFDAWLTAIVYAALVSGHGYWWDYYLLDVVILLAWPRADELSSENPRFPLVAAASVVVCVAYAVAFGSYLRREEQKEVSYERAIRLGTLPVTEASAAPFGFLGWKLFATARVHAAGDARLIDFLHYVDGGRTYWADGKLMRRIGESSRSMHPDGRRWPLPSDWRDRPLPLSNGEWRAYLEAR